MTELKLAARVGRIKPSPTIAVSTRARELRAEGRDIVNLGSGEPDFDTPQHIKNAAIAAMREGQTKYTAVGGTPELKNAVCEKLQRENGLEYTPAQIIVSTGAKHALMNLMQAVLDQGDEVIVPAPYWVSYPDMALLADATPVVIAADSSQGFKITPQQLSDALTANSRMLLINSPSNPSGALYSQNELAALAEVVAAHPRLLVASDDIYEHIRYDGLPFANILNARPDLANRVVVINGVSKAFAMTGWRIGYAAGPKEIIAAMTKIQSQATSNTCSIAQAAAQAALGGGTECLAPMMEAFNRRRKLIRDGLNNARGIVCGDVAGAFYAFANATEAIRNLHSAGKIAAANDIALCEFFLEKAEVAAVPGSAFGAPGCFRVSFATSDENLQTAVSRIQEALL